MPRLLQNFFPSTSGDLVHRRGLVENFLVAEPVEGGGLSRHVLTDGLRDGQLSKRPHAYFVPQFVRRVRKSGFDEQLVPLEDDKDPVERLCEGVCGFEPSEESVEAAQGLFDGLLALWLLLVL